MPLALSGGASAAVICALALATQDGRAAEAFPLASATCFSSTFLLWSDLAAGADVRCAWLFWRELCRTDLSDVAFSDFAAPALSPSAADAGNGPAKPINSPAVKIKAALALIVM
jgi:hypothetical protein